MLRDIYKTLCSVLEKAEVEAPSYETRQLIEYVTGLTPSSQLAHADEAVSKEDEEKLVTLAKKRAEHYPLQYLLGSWSFMGIELKVGEGVLIPRDDTEVLANLCLDYLKGSKSKTALDLCAGSGAIAIALSKLAHAKVTAVELSDRAFNFLKENINLNNADVSSIKGDVFQCHSGFEDGSFDLIASNPPYIKSDEIKTLQPEVGFEPRLALDGGEDGFDFYRAIITLWSGKLKSGGALAFELGEGQAEYVGKLMSESGFISIKTAEDLGKTKRAIIGIRQ